jgi:GT2 family glycosyltransferase/glycosyltransferase involved in cell wall biosynthesis
MRISVVVPTFRRPQVLGRCLAALAEQDRAPDEVIVVVRAGDEDSARIAGGLGERVRVVKIEVPQGSPGVVMALNAGAAASTGDVVCFTDDDAEAHLDWLERVEATFALDPRIGAVGGRDLVFHEGMLEQGSRSKVGTVSRFGRVTGNHHLGVGPPRDVEVLKGVNLSVRGELVRALGFDARLQAVTTEHHWELALCLKLVRMGHRLVYDPDIQVDHHPQPRVAEERERGERDVRDAAHNETLALLEHLPPSGRAMHLIWVAGVGSRASPGVVAAVRAMLAGEWTRLALLRGNLRGRVGGLRTYLGSRRARAGRSTGAGPEVLSVCQSRGAAERARLLLDGDARVIVPGPGALGMLRSARAVLSSDAPVLYLVDVGKATTAAAVLGRLRRRRIVVDTGDAGYALTRSLGDRGPLGEALVGVGEQLALRCADEIVVRGRLHAERVPGRATHLPDLPPPGVGPLRSPDLAGELELEDRFVVGLVGSLIFSPRHRISYGWDLIEALPQTDPAVVALIVGDGSGLEPLRARAAALGVDGRCRFVGRVPVDRVSAYVGLMDAAISTQTNDVVGQVRTTGKLPLYLACGCPVLATHVGEAAALLSEHGWTIPYSGVVDRTYPARLAAAIETWRLDPGGEAARRRTALEIVAREFDASVMRARLAELLSGSG